MDNGHFYYITDQYFIDFPDTMLMQNKETVNGQVHDRPCFYAFKDPTPHIILLNYTLFLGQKATFFQHF